jgi:hypothetical protein
MRESALLVFLHKEKMPSFVVDTLGGGHTDVYKPKGYNLYYYDVNSLYPFVMKNYPMPISNPTWEGY